MNRPWKRLFGVLLVLALCLTLAAPALADSGNLIVNPDWEGGLDGWIDGYNNDDLDGDGWLYSSAYQDISLAGYSAGQSVKLSGELWCPDVDPTIDWIAFALSFWDASNTTQIGETQVEFEHSTLSTYHEIVAAIPQGAAYATVFLELRHTDPSRQSFGFDDLSFQVLSSASSGGQAAQTVSSDINVSVGGRNVQWTDAAPFIDQNNRTLVPLRAVAEALGLEVSWNAETREACFTDGFKYMWFPIGSTWFRADPGEDRSDFGQMDTAAVIVNNRTYAPVRYLAEYFGYTVDWDGATRTVVIGPRPYDTPAG